MIPAKTEAGQQVLKDRSVQLTQRQRAALILIDGKRSLQEVMHACGAEREDVERLFELELASTGLRGTPPPGAATGPDQRAG